MLHLDVVALDRAHASVLRGRLGDRGHAVRVRANSAAPPKPGGVRIDATLLALGDLPLARVDAPGVISTAGVEPHGAPLVVVARVDPTADAIEALYAAGVDAVLGAAAQRDLEAHVEALARLGRRGRAAPEGGARPRALESGAAVTGALALDQAALRRAARGWWSLASLDHPGERAAARDLAERSDPVVLRGERGVGRRHLARVLHQVAGREGGFVEVPCEQLLVEPGQLARRLAELLTLARAGTLCVTNATELSEDRAAALRAAFDAGSRTRLVLTAAPDAPLDLLRGRRHAKLEVAPLRERLDALPRLVRRLGDVELDAPALAAMQAYGWPGNVAELDAVLSRCAAACARGVLRLGDLPAAVTAAFDERDHLFPHQARFQVPLPHEWRITDEDPIDLRVYERKLILRAIAHCGGNRTKAAVLLGLGKSTFYRKLREG